MAKRWKHPLDLKTGRLAFSPVLRSTGERLDLVVDCKSFPSSGGLGFHGNTQDLKTGKWYTVYGKECDLPGCCRQIGSGRFRPTPTAINKGLALTGSNDNWGLPLPARVRPVMVSGSSP